VKQELQRTRMLIGDEGLDRLMDSKVCLLGLGGVGGAAFEALVRGGVGIRSCHRQRYSHHFKP